MTGSSRSWGLALPAVGVVACALAGATSAQAQSTAILRGTVLDSASRQPVLNAQIVVGGQVRANTDAQGRFTARTLPTGTVTVRVQRIGFQPQTRQVTLTAGVPLDVQFVLRTQAAILSDVVVVGYGTRSRAEVSAATAQVEGAQVQNQPVAGVDAALQGRAPGVQVTQNAGNPGNGITVRVRGSSSISASNQPLYVVDGVPIIQGDQSQIGFGGQGLTAVTGLNPDEIERIDVLKDAAASAIYGSRASNGVILITTKRGRATAPRWSFNAYYGNQDAARRLPLLNSQQYVEYLNEAWTNDGYDEPFDPVTGAEFNTDWQSVVLRTAPVNNFNLQAQGAGDRFQYLLSGSRFQQDGIVIGSGYNRGSGRVNADITASPKLSFRTSLALTREHFERTENDNTIVGTLANALANNPNVPLFTPGTSNFSTTEDGLAYVNSAAIAAFNRAPANALRFLGNIEATLTPTDRVRVTGRVGSDVYNMNERRWDSPRVADSYAVGAAGVGRQGNTSSTKWLAEAFADVEALRSGRQKLTVTAGGTSEYNRSEILFLRGEGFGSDAFQYPGTASRVVNYDGQAQQNNLLSAFSRANYSFADRYLVTASVRTDGSSRFGPSRRWGFFPAASVGWNVTEEGFASPLKRYMTAKLRASYGLTGNQNIPTLFGFQTTYARTNYAGAAGISPNTLGNPDLRWEQTREADIGLDLGFFGGRVSVIADYYSKLTTDLLVQRPVTTTSGFASIWDNVGNLRNAGVEFQVTTQNVRAARAGNFDWTSDFNISANRNRITSLYQGQPFASGIGSVNWVAVGQPIGTFYTLKFQGVDPETGDAIYDDLDGDGAITSADRQVVGNAQPRFYGGFRNALAWKGIDLNVFFQFTQGQRVFNLFRQYADDGGLNFDNKLAVVLNRWQKPGDITDQPRASTDNTSDAYRISSRYVEDASYVRLQDVTLGYRLPRALVGRSGVQDARIFVQGNNLKVWTKYLGFDPDVNSNGANTNTALGTDFYAYPRARTVSVGLSGSF